MRDLGTPVLPPVSNVEIGLSAYAFGTQRRTGPPLSHSSSKNPKRSRSSYFCISRRGSNPSVLARSSQKGVPVEGSKCQWTTSLVHASSAALVGLVSRSAIVGVTVSRFPAEVYET